MSEIILWIKIQVGDLADRLILDDEPHSSEPDILPAPGEPD